MMSRSHVVSGAAVCLGAAGAGRALLNSEAEFLAPARDFVSGLVNRYVVLSGNPGLEIVLVLTGLALFFFGTILPDVDQPNSTVSKILHFYLPLPHRRFTHSIWPTFAFFCAGWKYPILMYLFAGYAVHIFMDKFSAAGVCVFWPLTQYQSFDDGAFVARGHKLKCYRAGEGSEILFVFVVWTFALLLFWCGFKDAVLGFISRVG